MNLERKGKVFLWTGVVMLAIAGGVWVANGGIGRIKTALANDQGATSCSTPGCFSEKWTANEIFGVYRFAYTDYGMTNRDTGRLNDNPWATVTGTRLCNDIETGTGGKHLPNTVSPWATGTGSSSCTYRSQSTISNDGGTSTVYGYGFLDSSTSDTANTPIVTVWEVNGHVH